VTCSSPSTHFHVPPGGAGVLAQQVVVGLDQEAGGAAGRVADAVGRLRLHQLHHQRMMWRGVRNWPLMPAVVSLLSRYS
jgi:hypothetical protein